MKYSEFEKKLRDKLYYMQGTHEIFEHILEDVGTHGEKIKYVAQFVRRHSIKEGYDHSIHHTILIDATHNDALSVNVLHEAGCRLEFAFDKLSKNSLTGCRESYQIWNWEKTINNAIYGRNKFFIFEMRDKID